MMVKEGKREEEEEEEEDEGGGGVDLRLTSVLKRLVRVSGDGKARLCHPRGVCD